MRMFVLGLSLAAAAPVGAQQIGPPSPTAVPKQPMIQVPPVTPKRAPINGVLTLYGNERCPTDNDGNEIVICERRSAQEQFRVPKELRELQVTPENESWAANAQGALAGGSVGVNGIGSCSTVGAGGATGCFGQRARAAKKENQARKASEAWTPDR